MESFFTIIHCIPFAPIYYIQYSRINSLEFLFVTLPLTPHQIGIGWEITLISSTLHALEVFMMPIMTFEKTLD
jgi:hypothetical protein